MTSPFLFKFNSLKTALSNVEPPDAEWISSWLCSEWTVFSVSLALTISACFVSTLVPTATVSGAADFAAIILICSSLERVSNPGCLIINSLYCSLVIPSFFNISSMEGFDTIGIAWDEEADTAAVVDADLGASVAIVLFKFIFNSDILRSQFYLLTHIKTCQKHGFQHVLTCLQIFTFN